MKKGTYTTSKQRKELEVLDDIKLYDESKRLGGRSILLVEYAKKRAAKK